MNTPNTRKFLNKSSPPSMFTLICLAAIGALALNMHLPSLPAMAVTFGISYSVTTLSISLFLGMNAVFQIFVGPLSDRYGRRPIVLGSLFIFCLCSVGCILATNFEFFLICRIFQAVVVAGLVISRAAVRDSYHQDQAASILGYVTMGMAIFPLIGPALGGVLEVKFGWIASFWVLLGVGIFIFLLTYFDMGETNRHKTASMTEQFHAYPELLKSRRFWGYSLTAAFNAGGYYAYLGGAAYVGLEIFELSPDILGFYIGSPVLGYVIGNGLSGRYSVAFGINKMISMGSMITSMGMILCIGLFTMTVPIPLSFFGCVFLTAIGHGMVLPNSNAGMMSVRPKLAGSASGLGGALNTGGGAVIATGTAAVLIPGTGALTLILIMLGTSIASIFTITYAIMRTKKLEMNNHPK